MSYDNIRLDLFKKNAPFDGVIFEIDNPNIDVAIKK